MNKSRKVIFFGNEQIATSVETQATIFSYLCAEYDVQALIISEKNNDKISKIESIAISNNIPVYNFDKPNNHIKEIEKYNAEVAVLIAYGKIISQEVIDIFPVGIVNLHPSLLPLHRGPTPLEAVLLNGENKTGVSLMKLGAGMDSGPIYSQEEITLKNDISKQELSELLISIGLKLIKRDLGKIISGEIEAIPQDDKLATYDKLITKSDGIIDWNKTTFELGNQIRAYLGWPGSKTKLGQIEVTITKAEANHSKGAPGEIKVSKEDLIVHTKDSSLKILEIQPSGKKNMRVKDFLAGYRDKITDQ